MLDTGGVPRSMWTGAISFGLVTVPVKLYSAVSRKTRALPPAQRQDRRAHPAAPRRPEHRRRGRLRGHRQGLRARARPLRRHRAATSSRRSTRRRRGRSTSRSSSSSPTSTRSSTTTRTTSRPAPGGAKPYRLLLDAMRDTGRVAIATRRHPLEGAARRDPPDGRRARDEHDGLRRRGHRPEDDRRHPAGRRRRGRRPRGRRSPSSSSSRSPRTSSPSKFRDTYRDEVLALIERKAAGEEIAVQPARDEEAEPVPDLMAALKASLDAVRARRRRRRARSPSRRSAQAPVEGEGLRPQAQAAAKKG